jgi:uncharacterized protein (TIGR02246 family)
MLTAPSRRARSTGGAHAQAWRDKDADAAAALFTPDASYQSHPTAGPHQGTEAIRAYWARATATQRQLDLRFGQPIVAGNRAAVEWWAVMRDSDWGPERADDSVTLPGCLVLSFAADGRCTADGAAHRRDHEESYPDEGKNSS